MKAARRACGELRAGEAALVQMHLDVFSQDRQCFQHPDLVTIASEGCGKIEQLSVLRIDCRYTHLDLR
jgi:hypothetical protein